MRPLVVIPTYDEVGSLPATHRRLRAAGVDADVLVVDDNSPDGTGELANRLAENDERLFVLHRQGRGGLGGAYRAGFAWGLERDYDAFVEMDADGSHDPADLPRLVQTLGGADLVIGSRYVPGGGVADWPRRRLWLSKGGNRYVRLATGLPVNDATAGFRAYRRTLLEALDLTTIQSEGYSFQIEMALRTWQAGFTILEVPILFTERQVGASKMNRAIVAEALRRITEWGWEGPRHPDPPHPASVRS